MPLLIDTMNVLHVTGVLPPDLAGLDVGDLAELIGLSRHRSQHTTLVCDGQGSATAATQRIDIRYSGKGKTADDVLVRMIQRSSSPRRLLVVSSDHALMRAARKRRCAILTSEAFLRQLAADVRSFAKPRDSTVRRPASASMSAEQVAKWERIFDVDLTAISKAVENDVRISRDGSAEIVRPTRKQRAAKPKPGTRRLDEHTRTRHAQSNLRAEADDRDPPKPVLPRTMLDEAEELVREFEAKRKHSRSRPTPG